MSAVPHLLDPLPPGEQPAPAPPAAAPRPVRHRPAAQRARVTFQSVALVLVAALAMLHFAR
ncbi:MAG TPA: hypothetical protein VFS08_17535, partial [Gemmatimonadaceae bacterium]|nr:hypothetical protein [Gemmatimonadaceae bacterium]